MTDYDITIMVITLLGMSHCGTILGNDVARDIYYDTMDNDFAMYT